MVSVGCLWGACHNSQRRNMHSIHIRIAAHIRLAHLLISTRREFYGSTTDWGWGPWSAESGWTSGWITATLALRYVGWSLSCWYVCVGKDSRVVSRVGLSNRPCCLGGLVERRGVGVCRCRYHWRLSLIACENAHEQGNEHKSVGAACGSPVGQCG